MLGLRNNSVSGFRMFASSSHLGSMLVPVSVMVNQFDIPTLQRYNHSHVLNVNRTPVPLNPILGLDLDRVPILGLIELLSRTFEAVLARTLQQYIRLLTLAPQQKAFVSAKGRMV